MATVVIPLTQGKVALIDEEDYERVRPFRWQLLRSSQHNLEYASAWEYSSGGSRRRILMHRHLLNVRDDILIDHIDGDGLNNRRANIRPATRFQNASNRHGPAKHNRLGVLGVYWHKDKQRFTAQITFAGKQIQIGRFKTLAEAISAREKAEQETFGDYGPHKQ